jgi:hypothetical protein
MNLCKKSSRVRTSDLGGRSIFKQKCSFQESVNFIMVMCSGANLLKC